MALNYFGVHITAKKLPHKYTHSVKIVIFFIVFSQQANRGPIAYYTSAASSNTATRVLHCNKLLFINSIFLIIFNNLYILQAASANFGISTRKCLFIRWPEVRVAQNSSQFALRTMPFFQLLHNLRCALCLFFQRLRNLRCALRLFFFSACAICVCESVNLIFVALQLGNFFQDAQSQNNF